MKKPLITVKVLEDHLYRITNDAPDEIGFLENSRERELSYSKRSAIRWYEIIKFIESVGPISRCLDIGTSPLTFALKHYYSEVDTLDFSDHFASRCRSAGITLYLPGREWLDNIPDETYDCILFLEVIEHLHMNPEAVLKLLQAKLRRSGWLIMSTPNLMCLGNRIRMLFNRKKLLHFHYPPFIPLSLHGHGHDRVYTPPEMKDYLENTHWSTYKLGYHGVAVADSIGSLPFLKKMMHIPALPIKYLLPSTRQLMLVVAQK